MAKIMDDQQLISQFASGIEEGQYASVFAQSKRFVVFKIAGHSAWNGNYCPRVYVRTKYILIKKGQWWLSLSEFHHSKEWSGQSAKKDALSALAKAERIGKAA